ncbi:hypothetical protein [Aquimarina sp. 2201CG5-10]|uniref:SPW repeat domain-containing protein n=1 Tax=Aquimarina callyspongiae TaxID=3098150 RepID=UPI002AB44196|nr:hypothetical protein [Aquimarina sp. 2201CG5-10]MDY8137432.1 hypothetical protein [Aquimarina sp. 2201CG5-10]
MRFITQKIHAFLDYPVAIALIALPFLLGLGNSSSLAFSISLVVGIAAFILTLLTDHELGAIRVIPYKFHLIVDLLVGILFVLVPFILAFKGVDAYYYWIIGGSVLLVVSMHKPETAS